jgi:hypothetical protein
VPHHPAHRPAGPRRADGAPGGTAAHQAADRRADRQHQGDIYNLLFHNDVGDGPGAPIEAAFIAALCARDWGLWRTCQLNIERSQAHLAGSGLAPDEQQTVGGRLESLRERIDAEPKSVKWRLRSRAGDRVRWYDEPEEEDPAGR